MITIQFMKPFYTKVVQERLRLVFAYQYLSIVKDEEVFHFIPIEGKEIIVDVKKRQVINLSEVFVFQRGNRFIRLPLYQLLLVSNIGDYLTPVIDEQIQQGSIHENKRKEQEETEVDFPQEILSIINVFEKQNLDRLIDQALTERNEEMFYKLLEQKETY